MPYACYDLCRAHQLGIWIGTMPELGIGQAQAAALSSLPGCTFPTDVEASARWFCDDIIDPWLEVGGGMIAMPTAPGLGYRVDAGKLARYKVQERTFASEAFCLVYFGANRHRTRNT